MDVKRGVGVQGVASRRQEGGGVSRELPVDVKSGEGGEGSRELPVDVKWGESRELSVDVNGGMGVWRVTSRR